MTNEIGLTWEELRDIVGMAYIHADGKKDDRLFEIRRWLDSKSGPINIVEDKELKCGHSNTICLVKHPIGYNCDHGRCGAKPVTHKVQALYLCEEHAKQYYEAEAL